VESRLVIGPRYATRRNERHRYLFWVHPGTPEDHFIADGRGNNGLSQMGVPNGNNNPNN
jgi:hypothetical protein